MAKQYLVLKQRKLDLEAERKGIADKIEAEGRALTEEERARVKAIGEELAQVEESLSLLEAQRATDRSAPASQITGMRDLSAERPWASFGEFLQAVAHAGTPGGQVDPRLYQAAASGASTGVPSDGGFLVQTDYSTMLLNRAIEAAQLAPLCDSVPIGANSDGLEAPYIAETSRAHGSRWGGVRVYRRAEAETVAATKPSLDKFDLRLEDLMGLAYGTDRLLQDATAMEAIFTRAFTSEFAFKVDDEIIRGSGAGEALGVLNAPALVTVAKEAGQTATSVLMKNISNMWVRMPARLRGGAVWLYNQDVEPQLDELTIPAGLGAVEPRFVTYGPDGVLRIKGRPALACEQCETLGTVGDLMLVNLGEYALITKGGIDAQQSIHVRFIYGERTFRWITRINGAPKWKSSITPYKGSNAQSPYVALATRA